MVAVLLLLSGRLDATRAVRSHLDPRGGQDVMFSGCSARDIKFHCSRLCESAIELDLLWLTMPLWLGEEAVKSLHHNDS